MDVVILAAVLVASLVLIPLGLPGTWVMVGLAFVFNAVAGAERIGTVTIVGTALLAAVGEWIEFSLAGRFARKYGGSKRAGWGAIIGGMVGAFVGVPVPIVGSVVGAFVGSFVGAFLAEITRGSQRAVATRVATGALLGRAAAAAAKVAVGCVMGVWIVLAALG